MKAKNLNASSVKTRNLIRDTFAELLYEKKNINKITVTELVQRADINRSTFYSHYDEGRHLDLSLMRFMPISRRTIPSSG